MMRPSYEIYSVGCVSRNHPRNAVGVRTARFSRAQIHAHDAAERAYATSKLDVSHLLLLLTLSISMNDSESDRISDAQICSTPPEVAPRTSEAPPPQCATDPPEGSAGGATGQSLFKATTKVLFAVFGVLIVGFTARRRVHEELHSSVDWPQVLGLASDFLLFENLGPPQVALGAMLFLLMIKISSCVYQLCRVNISANIASETKASASIPQEAGDLPPALFNPDELEPDEEAVHATTIGDAAYPLHDVFSPPLGAGHMPTMRCYPAVLRSALQSPPIQVCTDAACPHHAEVRGSVPAPCDPADLTAVEANMGEDTFPLDDIFDVEDHSDFFNDEVPYLPDFNPPEFVSEPGVGNTRGKRTSSKKKEITYDDRTAELHFCPGAKVDWQMDLGIASKMPRAFAHRLNKKAATRSVTQRAHAAVGNQGPIVEFLYDSGCLTTQVPPSMRGLLDNVHTIPPIMLETAGLEDPVINEAGTLRFLLKGVATPIELKCHVSPGAKTPLIALDALERLDRGRIQSRLWADMIDFKGIEVPLVRRHDSPMLRITILSGEPACRNGLTAGYRAREAAHAARRADEPFDLVHRLCAHANADCCRRTAQKAKGLPSLAHSKPSSRPCPECTLAKLKAPSKGQGRLSTGHVPVRAGQVMCGDVFGPIQIPGLAGERYFIVLVCQFSRWGVARAFTSLTEVPTLVDEMLAEVRAVLDTVPTELIMTERIGMTMHSDNASVFKSAKHKARMAAMGINLTFSAPYEPRTNGHAERFGAVVMTTTRAMLLEGSFPPKFWSVMVRMACWTLNRLVRSDGNAPIETFAKKDIDFSNLHPAGTLAYWHVDKKQRDDPKLGNSAAVGVYLGPAEVFGQRGHLVYTTNDRLRAVSHILVDIDTKPFQLGMLKELLKESYRVTAVYDKAQVDPDAFILPNGDSAFNYIGSKTRKLFPDGLWYEGIVQRIVPPEDDEDPAAEIYFHTVYSDGDAEDYTLIELKALLIHKGKEPACAAASMDATREMDLNSALYPEVDTSTYASLNGYEELFTLASRNVAMAATARAKRSDSMPFGETYSWMKIFKMTPKIRAEHVAAMQAEINKLTDAKHARWEHLPPGEVAIPSVGVFRVKLHDLHTGGHTLKARFCANGQMAESPPGGWESTASVASYSQLLTVIALAAQMNLHLAQIDVKSAFTQVKLKDDERIWVRPLPGLGDPKRDGRVLRLIHHLYGHPLANAAFQDLWVSVMKEFGFTVVDASDTVFSFERGDQRMLVATVVDDSLVAYSHEALFREFTDFLEKKFPVAVSPVETICGMTVKRHADGSITVNQQEYIEKKALAFDCTWSGRSVFTPMSDTFVLGPRPEVADKKLVSLARELMGSLIYATLTRPECKYACSKLASIVTNPTLVDIGAMKRVLRYLYASRTTSLCFRPGPWTGPDGAVHDPLEFSVFVDAGFAQEEGRRSQTGFALMLAGAAILAKSGKQSQVTDSTGYSETIALHESANWAIVTRNLLSKMFAPQCKATRVYEDNLAATIFAEKGPGARSLHWDVKLCYVTEMHNNDIVHVTKINTKLQIADILTKALPVDMHMTLSAYLLGGPVEFA